MKFKHIVKLMAFGLVLGAFTACENAEYSEIKNRLYINEAAPESSYNQQVSQLVITGDVTTAIHVRLAQPLDRDVLVRIGLAPEFVEEYNRINGTSYEVLPEELLSFETKATIKAGSIASDDILISIKKFTSDVTYCVPLRITESNAPVPTTENTSRIMFVLATPLRQLVPMMDNMTMPSGTNDWAIATNEWTLEGWVWMSSFPINNQAIFNARVSKGVEIYIRFGDADVPYDKLQIKTCGSQFNSNQAFQPQTWTHVAFTCANGKVIMYINGEEDSSMEISGGEYVIENLQLCSSGSWFRADAQMAQVRLWTKALSQNIIKAQMNGGVPANSEGLVGYWKLDEGEGDVYHDATSYGRHLTCEYEPIWSTEVVDFSNPNK